MARIEVIRGDDFQRKVWFFDIGEDGLVVRLYRYAEQERSTRRHKFEGNAWNYDQRARNWDCLPKPKEIPHDILDEAIEEMVRIARNPIIYIGYRNNDDRYRPSLNTKEGK